jgi:Na+/melibiose symporter-like transporter
MGERGKRASPYRWAVLAAYMAITIAVEVQWVALAPVARAAERFYSLGPGAFGVDFLAMSYLLLYLVFCFPASYVIDSFGIRVGLGIGAVLAGLGGIAKGLFPSSFGAVLAGQIALAIAQPFVLNAATALGARWFKLRERGTAVGLASLAQFLGIALAMVIGPLVVNGDPSSPGYGSGVDALLRAYGVGTAAAAALSLLLLRERPREAVEEEEARHDVRAGLLFLFKSRDYRILIGLFAIGLGIFNALSSMVDAVAASIGVVDSDGLIGTVMIGAGILGALVLPILSDAAGKRRPFLILCMAGMVPGVAGLALAGALCPNAASAYLMALISAGVLGFFVMAAGPIGFEYAAEIGRPAPESTSQGLLLLAGQATGIAFMSVMGVKGLMGLSMIVFIPLSVLCLVGTFAVRESKAFQALEPRVQGAPAPKI